MEEYNQSTMRSHILQCIEIEEMLVFPSIERRLNSINTIEKTVLYQFIVCVDELMMIECEKCMEWYHTACISIDKSYLKDPQKRWLCSMCQGKVVSWYYLYLDTDLLKCINSNELLAALKENKVQTPFMSLLNFLYM